MRFALEEMTRRVQVMVHGYFYAANVMASLRSRGSSTLPRLPVQREFSESQEVQVIDPLSFDHRSYLLPVNLSDLNILLVCCDNSES